MVCKNVHIKTLNKVINLYVGKLKHKFQYDTEIVRYKGISSAICQKL